DPLHHLNPGAGHAVVLEVPGNRASRRRRIYRRDCQQDHGALLQKERRPYERLGEM
ncbi:hypothetical protein, partial [Pseudomonas sp. FEN]